VWGYRGGGIGFRAFDIDKNHKEFNNADLLSAKAMGSAGFGK
jgi:hypothetical protein